MLNVLFQPLFDMYNHFGIKGTFKNHKLQKSNFSKNQKPPYNFFVFWATRIIQTFLKYADKTLL